MPETGIVNNREPEVTIRFGGAGQGFVYAGSCTPRCGRRGRFIRPVIRPGDM
jgi:hypothetical protein